MTIKRYKMHVTDVLDYFIGDIADIVDYELKDNKFVVKYCIDGETVQQRTITNKEIEKEFKCSDVVWKYDKDNSLDRVTYARESED